MCKTVVVNFYPWALPQAVPNLQLIMAAIYMLTNNKKAGWYLFFLNCTQNLSGTFIETIIESDVNDFFLFCLFLW